MDYQNLPTNWDLTKLCAGDEDPAMAGIAAAWEKATAEFVAKWQPRTDYLEQPEVLVEALAEYCDWLAKYGGEAGPVYYFGLRAALEKTNAELKAKENWWEDLSRKIMNTIQFFELRLAKIPTDKQAVFLEFPQLSEYKHFLQRSFENAKYLLSEDEEKIMLLKSPSAKSAWVSMISSLLSKQEREVLMPDGTMQKKPYSDISSLLADPHKPTRDSAAEQMHAIYAEFLPFAEHELNAILADKKVNDQLRGYEYAYNARLLADDIDGEVVESLSNAVADNFALANEYYDFKAKLLGADTMGYHERNVAIGATDEKYPYPEAAKLVHEVMQDLDPEFNDIFAMFANEGHIDVNPRAGKSSGAFCAYALITQPVYILLNHTDKLNDVLTLAHEVGHGINDELMRKHQNPLNFGSPLSTAEVASTFFEDFVLEKLRTEATPEQRFAINMQKLNDDISTVFRQIACYRFEQELHATFREKRYLSMVEIGELFKKHMSAYMGPAVNQDPGAENWWVGWSHIRNYFYNYSYANGLLTSKALQRRVRADRDFVTEVKKFLSAGSSDSPKNIFRSIGVDITDKNFWQEGIQEIKDLLAETKALAKELGK